MIHALNLSRSALSAQRVRMDVIAGNIANAFTTRQEDGAIEPYRRRYVTLAKSEIAGGTGVKVSAITQDPSEFVRKYDPGHPDAIPEGPYAGYVQYPNVNMTMEYVDALNASRAYEANLALMNVTRSMLEQSLRLFA